MPKFDHLETLIVTTLQELNLSLLFSTTVSWKSSTLCLRVKSRLNSIGAKPVPTGPDNQLKIESSSYNINGYDGPSIVAIDSSVSITESEAISAAKGYTFADYKRFIPFTS